MRKDWWDEKSDAADQEEGTPEEEVGDGHDEEHLHPGHPLPVDPLQVVLHLAQISDRTGSK